MTYKRTIPGIQHILRFTNTEGVPYGDMILDDSVDTGDRTTIEQSKQHCHEALMHLDPSIKRFLNPQLYPVGMERGLATLRSNLAKREKRDSGR